MHLTHPRECGLEAAERCAQPKTLTERTIELLRKRWTTALESATNGGVLSLSQRVGDFRKAGWIVHWCWVDTAGGARVKAYRIDGRLPGK